jgi:hypothetical protein
MSNTKIFGLGAISGIILMIILWFTIFKPSGNLTKLQTQEIQLADLAMFNEEKAKAADSLETIWKDTVKLITHKKDSSDKAKDSQINTVKSLNEEMSIKLINAEIKQRNVPTVVKIDSAGKLIVDTMLITDYNVLYTEKEKDDSDIDYLNTELSDCNKALTQCDTSKAALKSAITDYEGIIKDKDKEISKAKRKLGIGVYGGYGLNYNKGTISPGVQGGIGIFYRLF